MITFSVGCNHKPRVDRGSAHWMERGQSSVGLCYCCWFEEVYEIVSPVVQLYYILKPSNDTEVLRSPKNSLLLFDYAMYLGERRKLHLQEEKKNSL